MTGCAGLETTPPVITAQAISAERIVLQNEAISTHVARTKMLQDLAWPILKNNADLCGKKIQRVMGWRMLDAKQLLPFVQGLRAGDAAAAGWDGTARIGLVIAGGPAERAGMLANDRVLAVEGEKIPPGSGVVKTGLQILSHVKKTKPGTAIKLSVAQPGQAERSVSVTPETVCAFPLSLNRSSAVNAQTNGKRITFFLGLIRAETDPRRVQFVIAHELAHAVMRHPQKGLRNSLVSGGAVAGAVAATGGWLLDSAASIIGKKPTVSYQRQGLGLATYPYGRDFEREADYVGLYALARAGIDIAGVEELFTTFARESPSGTWLNLTHPSSPERWLAVRATQAEIVAKQAQNAPLLPNGWKKRSDPNARAQR